MYSGPGSAGRVEGAAELIPNPSVLINTLPLLEAQASSEIENIVTTTDRLFQFRELGAQADPATKEALRYSRALLEGYQAVQKRPLTTRTAEEICSLNHKECKCQCDAFRVRHWQNERTGEIGYTPPEVEDLLRSLLANWERFLHETTDFDPLIRMAVAHYQFEAIHPFTRREWKHRSRAEQPVLHSRPVDTSDSLLKPLHPFNTRPTITGC